MDQESKFQQAEREVEQPLLRPQLSGRSGTDGGIMAITGAGNEEAGSEGETGDHEDAKDDHEIADDKDELGDEAVVVSEARHLRSPQ